MFRKMYIPNAVVTETIMFESVDLVELTRWEQCSEPPPKCVCIKTDNKFSFSYLLQYSNEIDCEMN